MCGVAGVYSYAQSSAPLDEAVGLRMLAKIEHRGPDDGGLLVAPQILLGHRRLSVLDVSAAGHQPMSDAQERYWISFNGEIYNYRELRSELESLGYRFRSDTDTEVVLYAFKHWGLQSFTRLNGMFAMAIWDSAEQQLYLVRDGIGIKPMHFHDDGKRLRFGSEIKAILADPQVPHQPDWQGLDAFFTFGYMPAPRTGFAGIRQLMPGECLIANSSGCKLVPCCELTRPEISSPKSEPETLADFRERLDAAVNRQMVSDVPLGALLSGGLDSSAVVRAMRADDRDVLTFSMGFGDRSFDESPHAQQVADLLGCRHHSRYVDSDDALDLLPRVVSHAEEPLADNSMIPFYLLAQFTREKVTVALSGDGADELLAGYSTYRASRLAGWYRSVPRPLRQRVIAPLARQLPPSTRKYSAGMFLRRFVEGAECPPPRDHCSWRQILSPAAKRELYSASFRGATATNDPIGQYAAAAEALGPEFAALQRQLEADLRFHLPNDMLVKVDRMSMAHSLEVRVPWLDLELVRYCRGLGPEWKLRGGRGKYVLRKSLEDSLPKRLIHRRKAGFVVPIEAWLRGPLQPMLREYLSDAFLQQTDVLQAHAVRQMIDDHGRGRRDHAYELFTLLVFALWWRIWIDQSLAVATTARAAAPVVLRRVRGSNT